MKKLRVVLALVALGLPRAADAQKLPVTDFPWAHPGQHAENISEKAYGAIFSTASILSGETLVRFKVVPVAHGPQEGIWYGYTQAPCLSASEQDREKSRFCREMIAVRKKAWLIFLTAKADRDQSGFVTTEEAEAIYEEVQTALQVSQLRIGTPEGLLRLVDYRRLTKATVLARLTSYEALRAAALRENLSGLPELPEPLLRAAEGTVARLAIQSTPPAG
jgi:hypothetical protein